jgi:hypothetical protein
MISGSPEPVFVSMVHHLLEQKAPLHDVEEYAATMLQPHIGAFLAGHPDLQHVAAR